MNWGILWNKRKLTIEKNFQELNLWKLGIFCDNLHTFCVDSRHWKWHIWKFPNFSVGQSFWSPERATFSYFHLDWFCHNKAKPSYGCNISYINFLKLACSSIITWSYYTEEKMNLALLKPHTSSNPWEVGQKCS